MERKIIELEVKEKGMDEFAGKATSLRTQLKEMKMALAGMGEGTAEFNKLTREAGKLQDKISDLNRGVKAFASDTRRLDIAVGGVQLAAGAFGAVTASAALFGGESEELQKTMMKLQGALTLVTSVQAVATALTEKSAFMTAVLSAKTNIASAAQVFYTAVVGGTTGAMKLLRLAMLALPIVAIIAGVVAIAAAMGAFGDETDKAAEEQKKLQKELEQTAKLTKSSQATNVKWQSDLNKQRLDAIELARAKGATDSELHKLEVEQKKDALQMLRNQVAFGTKLNKEQYTEAKQLKTDIELLEAKHATKLSEIQKTANEKASEKKKVANEKTAAEQKAADDLVEELRRKNQDLVALNIENENKRAIEQLRIQHERENSENLKKFGVNIELEKATLIKQENELFALITEQNKTRDEAQKVIDDKKIADDKITSDKIFANKKAAKEAEILNNIETTKEGFAIEQNLKAELAKIEMDQALLNTDLQEGEKFKIIAEYDEKLRALKKETTDHETALNKESITAGLEWAEKGLNAIDELTSAFFTTKLANVKKGSKEEEKLQRKAFKMNKAMQMGSAIINTALSITKASPVVPLMVFAGITGAAAIAKIAATQFEGGGGGSLDTPTAPSGAGGVNAPNFNVVGNSGINQLGQLQQAPIQAYVVSGEMTTQQALDRNRLQNATL